MPAVLVRSAEDRKFYLPEEMVMQSSTLKNLRNSMIEANKKVDIYLRNIKASVLEKFESYFGFHSVIIRGMEIKLEEVMMNLSPYLSNGEREYKKAIASLKKAREFPYKSIFDMTPQIEVVDSEVLDAKNCIDFYSANHVEVTELIQKIKDEVKVHDDEFMKNLDINSLVEMLLAIQLLLPIDNTTLSGLEIRLCTEFRNRKVGKSVILFDPKHEDKFHDMNDKLEEKIKEAKRQEAVAKRQEAAAKQLEAATKEMKRLEEVVKRLKEEEAEAKRLEEEEEAEAKRRREEAEAKRRREEAEAERIVEEQLKANRDKSSSSVSHGEEEEETNQND